MIPALRWTRAYDRTWLSSDIIAGITVGTFAIPECLAYASLAGLPLQVGLYAEISALSIYFLLGTSRQMSVGTTSALSILVGTTLGGMALANPSTYWAYASLTAILVCFIALGAWILRMGFIVKLISNPVLAGFTAGAAFYIASSQLSHLLGVPGTQGNFFDRVWVVLVNLGAVNLYTLAIGLTGIAFLWAMRRVSRRFPGAILLVIASIILMTYTGLGDKGVKVVGDIPEGLPLPTLPSVGALDLNTWATLLTLALACLLLAYVEGTGIARSFVVRDEERLDANQELLALSGINLASGLTQGFPVGGSVSRSAVNYNSGAKTQLANAFAALVVVVVTLSLTGLFANLPQAILAAVVIHAVAGLVDTAELRRIYAVSRRHFAVAMVAFGTVLVFGLLIGIVVGILLSTINLLERIYNPHTARLGLEEDTCQFEDIAMHPNAREIPGVLVYRVDAPLVFMNAEAVREGVQDLVLADQGKSRMLILDLENCHEVDITALDMITMLYGWLGQRSVEMRISNASDQVVHSLVRSGLIRQFPNANDTVQEQLKGWGLKCLRK